jgi:DhnA family fructose-bisphosphate aldolase class Ia
MPTHSYHFQLEQFFPRRIFDQITNIRVDAPEIIERQALDRQRRAQLTRGGKLTILAVDHPARGVTASGSDPFGMGNRHEYLGRTLRVLIASDFDGVMGTPDIIEELLIVDYLVQQGGGPSFLDQKVLIGCMQRGGIAGAAGEIYDRFTSYTAESLARLGLDGGKMLLRFVDEESDSLRTLADCAQAVIDLNRYRLPAFVEPMRVVQQNGKYATRHTAEELIRLAGIASALGDSSRYLWLKLPYCEGYERVALATTLPIVLLGGPSREDPLSTFQDIAAGMAAGPNVRGVMVGRNVVFPGREDPAAVAQALDDLVVRGAAVAAATERMVAHRDHRIDALTRYI